MTFKNAYFRPNVGIVIVRLSRNFIILLTNSTDAVALNSINGVLEACVSRKEISSTNVPLSVCNVFYGVDNDNVASIIVDTRYV